MEPAAPGMLIRQIIAAPPPLDLQAMRQAVRRLGGYRDDEALDSECESLIALVEMLDNTTAYHVPKATVRSMREDAIELVERIELRAA